jgi:hypothetical protein
VEPVAESGVPREKRQAVFVDMDLNRRTDLTHVLWHALDCPRVAVDEHQSECAD